MCGFGASFLESHYVGVVFVELLLNNLMASSMLVECECVCRRNVEEQVGVLFLK